MHKPAPPTPTYTPIQVVCPYLPSMDGGVTAAEYNIDTLLTDVSTLAFLANARFALFQCGSSYPCEWVSQ